MIDLVEQAVEILQLNAAQKGLTLRLHIDPDTPRYAWIDALRLKQVLTNLLGNATKFTNAGEVGLTLGFTSLDDRRGRFDFCIRDTGIGIQPEDRDKLFEAFSQVDMSITRSFGGMGLGLAIANQLVKNMGGEIAVDSTWGVGSSFSFSIESAYAYGEKQHPAKQDYIRRVLVVEDNEINRLLISAMIEEFRPDIELIEVSMAHDGVDLLRQRDDFDLVLMDIKMPDITGVEAARLIRKQELTTRRAAIPIVAFTADATRRRMEECRQAGMNDFLAKPIDATALLEILDRYVGIRSA